MKLTEAVKVRDLLEEVKDDLRGEREDIARARLRKLIVQKKAAVDVLVELNRQYDELLMEDISKISVSVDDNIMRV